MSALAHALALSARTLVYKRKRVPAGREGGRASKRPLGGVGMSGGTYGAIGVRPSWGEQDHPVAGDRKSVV